MIKEGDGEVTVELGLLRFGSGGELGGGPVSSSAAHDSRCGSVGCQVGDEGGGPLRGSHMATVFCYVRSGVHWRDT